MQFKYRFGMWFTFYHAPEYIYEVSQVGDGFVMGGRIGFGGANRYYLYEIQPFWLQREDTFVISDSNIIRMVVEIMEDGERSRVRCRSESGGQSNHTVNYLAEMAELCAK